MGIAGNSAVIKELMNTFFCEMKTYIGISIQQFFKTKGVINKLKFIFVISTF